MKKKSNKNAKTNTLNKAILITLFLMLWHFTNAQVSYTYDANGNRILRNIVTLMSQPIDTTNQDTIVEIIKKQDYLALESNYNEELGEQTITIYPNPTGGAFAVGIINMPDGIKRKMVLYSMSGKEVFYKDDLDELTVIDVSAQQSGTYLLKIMLGDKQTTWKIVKR
ncbi:MAG: T9SS type A sorting domain-containing protein [Bacteroidales bacterium]|nr:T9SS type A sorting domain-containing protein [Bacteroidales bacterium]